MGLSLFKRQPSVNGPPLAGVPIEPLDLVFLGGGKRGHGSNPPARGIGKLKGKDASARVSVNLDTFGVDAILRKYLCDVAGNPSAGVFVPRFVRLRPFRVAISDYPVALLYSQACSLASEGANPFGVKSNAIGGRKDSSIVQNMDICPHKVRRKYGSGGWLFVLGHGANFFPLVAQGPCKRSLLIP